MNTGIGDAVNLGWKLAQVLQNRADARLLASYEPERIGFARSLVATTDRAFTGKVAGGLAGECIRRIVAPLFLSVATRFAFSRHAIFRLVSQTRIHYEKSPLSEGQAGEVSGGDRLPWVRSALTDNFAPLRSLDWQLHVYGTMDDAFAESCRGVGLTTYVFPWDELASGAGFKRDAAYLVRPDGYVALASPEQNASTLKVFLDRFSLRFK